MCEYLDAYFLCPILIKLDSLRSRERVVESGEPIASLTDNAPSHLFESSCHYISEWARGDGNYSRTELISGNVRVYCPDRTRLRYSANSISAGVVTNDCQVGRVQTIP